MLGGSTSEGLKQGVKVEVILDIETKYNKSNAKMFNVQFTSESDFINWVKVRMEKFPDESTMRLLALYDDSK